MKKHLFLPLVILLAFAVATFAQNAVPSSDEIMNKAYAQAKKENKKVITIFHASWCGWCKKMEASINEPELKKFFEDNYVIVYLTVQESKGKEHFENPGAMALMTKFKGEKAGLPFWFITDANGKALADSQVRPEGAGLNTYGNNVGCPASEKEVAFFTNVLKFTSKLTDKELTMIGERFAKNK